MRDAENRLPIRMLIEERKTVLGLNASRLAHRCGYTNTTKGIRRLDELCGGYLELPDLIKALPSALEVPAEAISQAIEDTRRVLQELRTVELRAAEEAWRASFVPHAIVLTERTRPEPIFAAACFGMRRLLVIELDHTEPEQTFPQQARNGLAEKLASFGSAIGQIPAYGSPTGFVVNFTPDRAVEFALSGDPIRVLDKAYRPHGAFLMLGSGKPLEGVLPPVIVAPHD